MSNERKKKGKSKICYLYLFHDLKRECGIWVRVTFNALVLITSCQMSARNERNLKFGIFYLKI